MKIMLGMVAPYENQTRTLNKTWVESEVNKHGSISQRVKKLESDHAKVSGFTKEVNCVLEHIDKKINDHSIDSKCKTQKYATFWFRFNISVALPN